MKNIHRYIYPRSSKHNFTYFEFLQDIKKIIFEPSSAAERNPDPPVGSRDVKNKIPQTGARFVYVQWGTLKTCCQVWPQFSGIPRSLGTDWLTCLLSERLIAFEWNGQTQNTFLMESERQTWLISPAIRDTKHIFILFKNNMYS